MRLTTRAEAETLAKARFFTKNKSTMQQISLQATDQRQQIEYLKQSRLKSLINDEAIFSRVCEAALLLLTNDKVRACDEASIMGALYKAATIGFRLEPEFGECYLIPRNVKTKDEKGQDVWKSVCTFQIGYKGWKAKALESGHITHLEAREVYAEDVFSFQYGTSPHLSHTPADENKGITTHFYAFARLKVGGEIFEVSNKQAAEKSRRNSETQYDVIGSGPTKQRVFSEKPKEIWAKHYAQMALRTPIKRLCAMLPLTPAIEAAQMADGALTYLQKDGTVTTISPADVEASAEQSPGKSPVLDMDAEIAAKYLEVSDALTNMDFGAMLRYFEHFDRSEYGTKQMFAQLFFKAAVKTFDIEELAAFFKVATRWHKTPALVKIISDRKTQILKNAAQN